MILSRFIRVERAVQHKLTSCTLLLERKADETSFKRHKNICYNINFNV